MANKKGNNQKNSKIVNKAKKEEIKQIEANTKRNEKIMKILTFLGVLIFFFIIVYLMYHFFVEKSDIKINMSTDKQMEYIDIYGKEELIMTQKYVSDLSYSMRYDVTEFQVFKYNHQDVYKNINNENIIIAVEKAPLPSSCTTIISNGEYNNCYIEVDNYTEEHYISNDRKIYKITIKKPGNAGYNEGIKTRVNHMISSFTISN